MPSRRSSIRASALPSATPRSAAARATKIEVIAATMIVTKATPWQHHEGRDDAPGGVLGVASPVAHGRDRLQRPPHADPDVRVLAVVEQPAYPAHMEDSPEAEMEDASQPIELHEIDRGGGRGDVMVECPLRGRHTPFAKDLGRD